MPLTQSGGCILEWEEQRTGDHSVSGGSRGPARGEAQPGARQAGGSVSGGSGAQPGVRPAEGLLAEDGPELAWQRG